jgi:predicted Zn finger-like uncharacterized protein
MIIQCEQCRTKFKLDDSKVPDKGVKVRCAKCKLVFSVAKELPDAEPKVNFGSMLDASVSAVEDEAEVQPEFVVPDDASAIEFEEDTATFSDTDSEHTVMIDSAPFEMEDEQEVSFSPENSSADQNLSSPEEDSMFPPVKNEAPDSINDVDFGAFAFNDEDDSTVAHSTLDFGDTPKNQQIPVESKKADFGGLDFSDDDMFGEVVPSKPEDSEGAISFDFGMDDFASSMGVANTATSQKNAFSITETSSDAPFSLDEIDFGDEFTSVGVQHVSPEELKPSQELLFAPLAEAQTKTDPGTDNDTSRKISATQEELPPLSIASRRKQSPLSSGLIAVLGIIIAGVVAFFGYSMFAGDKTNIVQETGHISVREVDATFVKNKLTGDLLVISGEAVNEFGKPRASIQIKGMVYGADGGVISSKNAFCGNPLTEEQLSTMSMEKIEAAMANQFGDSLANMEVAPGKAIPFVIVIAKPSAGAKDYGVEPAGSTVATGKQP